MTFKIKPLFFASISSIFLYKLLFQVIFALTNKMYMILLIDYRLKSRNFTFNSLLNLIYYSRTANKRKQRLYPPLFALLRHLLPATNNQFGRVRFSRRRTTKAVGLVVLQACVKTGYKRRSVRTCVWLCACVFVSKQLLFCCLFCNRCRSCGCFCCSEFIYSFVINSLL